MNTTNPELPEFYVTERTVWNVLNNTFTHVAMDADGSVWAYRNRPLMNRNNWISDKSGGGPLQINVVPWTTDWRQSLRQRPAPFSQLIGHPCLFWDANRRDRAVLGLYRSYDPTYYYPHESHVGYYEFCELLTEENISVLER